MKTRVIKFEGAHIHATATFQSTSDEDPYQNEEYTPLPPRFRAVGLMKYGVVKVVNQAKTKPTAMAKPNVRLLRRVQGSSPAITHDRGPIVPP